VRIDEATLVCWNRGDEGTNESRVGFSSLEELSSLCLSPIEGKLPDRVLVRITEDDGQSCTLALSFASIVRAPRVPSSE
jgi:hypothetical protein